MTTQLTPDLPTPIEETPLEGERPREPGRARPPDAPRKQKSLAAGVVSALGIMALIVGAAWLLWQGILLVIRLITASNAAVHTWAMSLSDLDRLGACILLAALLHAVIQPHYMRRKLR